MEFFLFCVQKRGCITFIGIYSDRYLHILGTMVPVAPAANVD